MTADSKPEAGSRKLLWAGRILSTILALLLFLDAGMKFARPQPVVEGTVKLGFPESIIIPLGVVLAISTLLYVIPRTAVLGAILLTGYLGGAVATHARMSDPLFSHTLFPTYIGGLLWLALVLKDSKLRALLPFRR